MNSIEQRIQILEDQNNIRTLAAIFAECCTLSDAERFAALWADDGVWTLSSPVDVEAKGCANITRLFLDLASEQQSFSQMIHSGSISVSGRTATSKWILSERAAGLDGRSYHSTGIYYDQLVLKNGSWLFKNRYFRFIDISNK